ncbi:MAG: PAS domain S-box protein [Anaerolineales bacterium]|nr:PAS domain S-box protein [Anaerolineales bacterium]
MKIRTKLYLSAAVSICLISILALLLFLFSVKVNEELKKAGLADEFAKAISELTILTDQYLAYQEPRIEQNLHLKLNSTNEMIKNAEGFIPLDIIGIAFESLNNSFSYLEANFREREELLEKDAPQEEVDRTIYLEERLAALMRSEAQKISATAFRISSESRQEVSTMQQRGNLLVSVFAVALVLTIGTSTFFITKSIMEPIEELVRGASIIGRGNLEHRIDIKGRDETGYLSQAFNEMVAQLKQQRDHLLESEERFRQFFENEPEYCYMISPEGIILDVNDAALKVLGYKKEELVGKPLQTIYAPESLPKMKQLFVKWEKTGALRDEEMNILTKDGDRRIVLLSTGVVRDKDGKLLRSVSVQRDITERKRAEEELRKHREHLEELVEERTAELAVAKEQAESADRLKSAFLATMSHELRTPLNSIIGFTGIILQGLVGPLNDEQTKQLSMVQGSAHHLLNLINDVLDISKIEAGQVEIVSEPFDMRQAIEKVVRTVTPLAEEKGLALVAEVAPEVGTITSDRRRVEQIVINLVNNAVKFTEQGEVRIVCQVDDGWLVTRVIDMGIGIKPDDMDKLFETFRQIDSTLTRQHEGTGLGLSICQKLVEMLGGEIWAESEWGVGSTFTFTLPTNT